VETPDRCGFPQELGKVSLEDYSADGDGKVKKQKRLKSRP